MLKGETRLLEGTPTGTPVELDAATIQRLKVQSGEEIRVGIVDQTLKHWEPDNMFAVLLLMTGRNKFERFTVKLPKNTEVRALTGSAGTELGKKYDGYTRFNIGWQMAGKGTVRLGCDPEVFAVDEQGVIIPAPLFAPDKKERTGFFWDGFQAEITPASESCLAFLTDYVHKGLKDLNGALKAKFPKGRLTTQNVIEVPDKMLKEALPDHVALGCDPSKNIYGLHGKEVEDGRLLPLRMAGGHIHFGTADTLPIMTDAKLAQCVKALDAIAGIVGVSLFANIDKPIRREYYGLPGEYRTPAHGLEYRTLSNAWLIHPAIMHLTIDIAREAFRVGLNDNLRFWIAKEELVIDTIRNHDVKAARAILTENRDMLTGLLTHLYRQERQNYRITADKSAELAYNAVMNGVESVVEDPDNIEKNWKLEKGWVAHSGVKGCMWGTAAEVLLQSKKLL